MAPHPVAWATAAPFWDALPADASLPTSLKRPAILRYAADTFMEEFLATLEQDPHAITQRAVVHETWRGPASAPPPLADDSRQLTSRLALRLQRMRNAVATRAGMPPRPASDAYRLKLYQPAHQRYYLVAANLVCNIGGLPDRTVDAGRRERTAFVVRRLFPTDAAALDPQTSLPAYDPNNTAAWREHAFVDTSEGARWAPVTDPDRQVLASEDRLPLFPAPYVTHGDRRRRLLAGLIPVAKREAYLGAVRATSTADGKLAPSTVDAGPLSPRLVLLHMQVLGPWKQLIERALSMKRSDGPLSDTIELLPADRRSDFLRALRAQVQTAMWYLLVDLKAFLKEQAKSLHDAIMNDARVSLTTDAERAAFDALDSVALPAGLATKLQATVAGYPAAKIAGKLTDALRRIGPFAAGLEARTDEFRFSEPGRSAAVGWPDFLFLLADADVAAGADAVQGLAALPNSRGLTKNANETEGEFQGRILDVIGEIVDQALPATQTGPVPTPSPVADPRADMREPWFVIRCVFERPECGELHPALVSAPTEAFQLAGYFDPDAPARPIRIGLPLDTTPAGLRKFDKKTMFVMSDILCGQIDRMKGLTFGDLIMQVLPWPLHKDLAAPAKGPCTTPGGLSLGVMCSLSIPIITLCALFLLMIMVSLLDFIFRWLPWFVVCLPLPGLKGKKSGP